MDGCCGDQAAAAESDGDVVAGLLRDIFGKEQSCTSSGRGTREGQGEDAGEVRACVFCRGQTPFTVTPDRFRTRVFL